MRITDLQFIKLMNILELFASSICKSYSHIEKRLVCWSWDPCHFLGWQEGGGLGQEITESVPHMMLYQGVLETFHYIFSPMYLYFLSLTLHSCI